MLSVLAVGTSNAAQDIAFDDTEDFALVLTKPQWDVQFGARVDDNDVDRPLLLCLGGRSHRRHTVVGLCMYVCMYLSVCLSAGFLVAR